ncbi:MAG: hypothetical protein L3J39_10425 [Verrucomicrobiales bacterium]|nr:hypothetical protein [Verrucomicrobiales bacterium]
MNSDKIKCLLAGAAPAFFAMRRGLLLLPMLVAIALCYVFEDFYPLSHFPMYSKFDERTYYVYLRDKQGEPVAAVPHFNIYTSDLKKHYGRDLKALKKKLKGSHFDWSAEQKWSAGMETLAYLKNERSPKAFEGEKWQGLALIDVRIRRGEDGKLERSEQVVGVME